MISTTVLTCLLNVMSRSSLNVIDRFLFGKKLFGFFYIYLLSLTLPCIIGIAFLLPLGNIQNLWTVFATPSCFLLSIATQLVGLSFGYAFRKHEVKQVILRAKFPELFLPLLLFFPFLKGQEQPIVANWTMLLPLIITWLGILPLALRKEYLASFCDRSTLFLSGSLLLQMFVSSKIPAESNTYSQAILLTSAMLLWRCLFTLPFCLFTKGKVESEENPADSMYLIKILLLRSIISFLTLLTFSWCIMEGNPLLIWPILNMTPLVATAASHLILKEKVTHLEKFALAGFFMGTSLTLMLKGGV